MPTTRATSESALVAWGWFTDLEDAQAAMAAWKEDYNESRPHTSLGGLARQQYVAQLLAGDALEEAI